MSLTVRVSQDCDLASVGSRVPLLQAQLDELAAETETIRLDYEKKCTKSLKSALKGLIDLCENVCNADSQLVFWVEKGKPLALLLKPLGIDREASAVVEKGTAKLKHEAHSVQRKFQRSGSVCRTAIAEVQSLNRRVNDYAHTSVGAVQTQASRMRGDYEGSMEILQNQITVKEFECQRVDKTIENTTATIQRAEDTKGKVESSAHAATIVSGFLTLVISGCHLMFILDVYTRVCRRCGPYWRSRGLSSGRSYRRHRRRSICSHRDGDGHACSVSVYLAYSTFEAD